MAVINNGMRGPFMPAGPATAAMHWAQPFLELLRGPVKLAGAYISCERDVHVQGPFQVTDRCRPGGEEGEAVAQGGVGGSFRGASVVSHKLGFLRSK